MGLPAKLVRAQLNFFKPFVANCSLEITRKGQDKLGELMEAIHRRDVIVRDHDFGPFQGAWIMPKDERRRLVSQGRRICSAAWCGSWSRMLYLVGKVPKLPCNGCFL